MGNDAISTDLALGATGLGALALAGHPLPLAVSMAVGAASLGAVGLRLARRLEEPYEEFPPLILGYAGHKPVTLSTFQEERHTMLIGQSGTGKTQLLLNIAHQQIRRGGGLLFIDPKLDATTLDILKRLVEMEGRSSELRVLNIDNPEASGTWNPMLAGDPDERVARIMMTYGQVDPAAKHWMNVQMKGLNAIIPALVALGIDFTLADIRSYISDPPSVVNLQPQLDRAITEQYAKVPRTDADRRKKDGKLGALIEARAQLRTWLGTYTDDKGVNLKRLQTDLSGLDARLDGFSKGKVHQVIGRTVTDIKLLKAIQDGQIVYVMLPTMGKDELSTNLARMILSDLRSAIFSIQKENQKPPSFLAILDEFGSYIIEGMDRVFEQSRSANVVLMPAVQTKANFDEISRQTGQKMTGNTWNQVFLRLGDPETREWAAAVVGHAMRTVETRSEGQGRGVATGGGGVFGRSTRNRTQSVSTRSERDYQLPPERFGELGIGEAIIRRESDVFDGARLPFLELPPADASPAPSEATGAAS